MKYLHKVLDGIRKIPWTVINRYVMGVLILGLQIGIIYFAIQIFQTYILWFYGSVIFVEFIFVLIILNRNMLTEFQMTWIIFILMFPAVGLIAYLIVYSSVGNKQIKKKIDDYHEQTKQYRNTSIYVKKQIKDESMMSYMHYLETTCCYKTYPISNLEYHEMGNVAYEALLKDLKKATKFILIETFILAKGTMWDEILSVLIEKVKEGVEVYLIYDGTCNFTLLPFSYKEELQQLGLKVAVFSSFKPLIQPHYNNRDHRKLILVDGNVAYHGGYNIADEYIGRVERFGFWKDTGIRIEGEAVNSFILMFFEMWYVCTDEMILFDSFLSKKQEVDLGKGYIIPFADNPIDEFHTAHDSYVTMIHQATKRVDIMTPYLILDSNISTALKNASLRGIKVRIIMPSIPDKKIVYYIGKNHYKELMDVGIEVYEYLPGFNHSKMLLCDSEVAIIGSINLDYRSFYLNYENASFIYQHEVLKKMASDFEKTLLQSEQMTPEKVAAYPFYKKLIGRIFKIFAPLM